MWKALQPQYGYWVMIPGWRKYKNRKVYRETSEMMPRFSKRAMSDSNADEFGEFSSFVPKKKKNRRQTGWAEREIKTRKGEASQTSNWWGWPGREDACEEQIVFLWLCGSVLGQASHDQASGFSGVSSPLSLLLMPNTQSSSGISGTEGTIKSIVDFES